MINKRYAEHAKNGEYPPEFRDDNTRLGDISYQLNRIANKLDELIDTLKK